MAPHKLCTGSHPTDFIPDLLFSPEQAVLTAEDRKKLGNVQSRMVDDDVQLCRACGWSTYNELTSSYLPRLRIAHTRGNQGLWNMGSEYMIWDRPNRSDIGADYMTVKFLQDKGVKDIPLVKEIHQYGKPGQPFEFVVMSRAPGVQLEEVWFDLSAAEKKNYAQQVTAALRELRKFTSPAPVRVDGSPIWDNIVGFCPGQRMCKTVQEIPAWFAGMDEELRTGLGTKFSTEDAAVIDAKLKEVKDQFPSSAPYVLTHADLNFGNFMVQDGKITAIIDWELAGYYPWWVERWASRQRAKNWMSDELFDIVWAELDPQHSEEDFIERVGKPVEAANSAYSWCDVKHTQSHDVWLRKPFCACSNVGGSIKSSDWYIAEMKHETGHKEETYARRTLEEQEKYDKIFTR